MNATAYYVVTILVYFGVDVMACWGLNLQYGVAGIYNLGYIVFQSLGAYIYAVLTLGPASGNGGFQRYIIGASLPFPLALLGAGVAGCLLAVPVGFVTLRRLRSDAQAMVFLVLAVTAALLVETISGLFNGPAGLSLVPAPLTTVGGSPATVGYQWFYVILTAVVVGCVYLIVHRVTSSPLGRALRATRDNDAAAEALGKDVFRLRLGIFVLGSGIAAISGAMFVAFISAWSPGSWAYVETMVFFTAIIIGGTANNLGVTLGALLVPVGFNEATRYLPAIGRPGLIDALQWVVIGGLTLLFLWFWPRGIVPERRRRFAKKKIALPDRAPEGGRTVVQGHAD
jgi:branched-chain amino acid transport system permease protein